jgi:hypothetical protein
MIDACIVTDTCPRCGGTADDGGFLACQQCNGAMVATVVKPLDEHTRSVLAADPDGVKRAEAGARALLDRLVALDGELPTKVAWRLVDWSGWRASGFDTLFQSLERTARDAHGDRKSHPDTPAILTEFGLSWGDCTTDPMAQHAIAAQAWKSAVLHGLRATAESITHGSAVPTALRGRLFSELADPFDPVVEIWRAGYAVGQGVESHLALVARLPSP